MTGLFTLSVFVLCLTVLPWVTADTWYERYLDFFDNTVPNDPELLELWNRHLEAHPDTRSKRADAKDDDAPTYAVPAFDCQTKYPWSGRSPNSVHNMHPSDISVIGAMGDSLTAAVGVNSKLISQAFIQYRGLSWSIGGDKTLETDVLTLPNILKKYNSKLYGYSVGTGDVDSDNARFNVANPKATSNEMAGQATKLIAKLKAHAGWNDGWKIITLFVGGNDLCDSCVHKNHTAERYTANIKAALDLLHASVPKTFVNVVSIFDIAPIANVGTDKTFCTAAHKAICPCGTAANKDFLSKLTKEYQKGVDDLINTGRYDTRNDFTVVVQPFFKRTSPPTAEGTGEIDMSYFAADCFHFSGKGHASAALSLWNNMCEEVGSKQDSWYLNQDFICPGSQRPTDHTFFQTSKNIQSKKE